MKQYTSTSDQKKTAKRHSQWSIMIVGTHGRVIPLRRFLPLAVVLSILVVMGISAIAGLSILYGRQVKQVHDLQARLNVLDEKAENLRLERDVYLAKVVITQEQLDKIDPSKPVVQEQIDDSGDDLHKGLEPRTPAKTLAVAESGEKPPARPVVDDAPPVKWGATTKRFSVSHDPVQKSLKVRFRIYNASVPKKMLSGRCVVVLKQKDDPPVKWKSLPSVLLTDGKPAGDSGYAFRINNYRTIVLTAIDQKVPVEFNSASIYIYHADGTQLYHEDHSFSIAPAAPPRLRPELVNNPPSESHSDGEQQPAVEKKSQTKAESVNVTPNDGSSQQNNDGFLSETISRGDTPGSKATAPTDPTVNKTPAVDSQASDESAGPKPEGAK